MDVKSLFETLIRENAGMLMAYIRSGVRDEHAADDVFQETVMVAWRRLDDFDSAKPLGPWLRGIAGKVILAHHRKQAKAGPSLDQQALEWLNDRFAAIQSLSGDTFEEKLSTLRECIALLPENYKQPITMRYTEERKLGDIQAALNLAAETLRKRLTRAKSRLADCLERKLGVSKPAV